MIRVRAATAGDGDFVAALAPRFVEHGVAGGHTREEVIEGTARALRRALAAPSADVLFLIAEETRDGTGAERDDVERIGFVYARVDRDYFTDEPYVHIEEIATTRSGDGIGTTLMDAAESSALLRGAHLVTLNVVEPNPADRFYAHRGYTLGHRHLVKRIT